MRLGIFIFFSLLVQILALPAQAQCPNIGNGGTATGTCTYNGNQSMTAPFLGTRSLTIAAGAVVTINGNLTITGATGAANLTINGILNVNGTLTIAGAFSNVALNSGGEIHVSEDVNNSGGFFFNNDVGVSGTMTVGGDFNNNNNGVLNIDDGGVVSVDGTFNSNGGSELNVNEGGTLVAPDFNDDGGDVTVDDSNDDTDCLNGGCCGAQCDVLPVELVYFKHQVNEHSECTLTWQTASELDNEGFYVEKKESDADEFRQIAFIPGNGTTSEPHAYAYTDQLFGRSAYYRLLQVDFDGDYEYFETLYVQAPKLGKARIYPNPFTYELHVVVPDDRYDLALYDMYGAQLLRISGLGAEQVKEELWQFSSSLKPGNYVLVLNGEAHQFKSRIIKQ